MSAPNAPGAAPSLADRLRAVRVGLRSDLEVSRHVFRGEPAYVVRDPMTFASHRIEPREYAVLARLTPDRTLGDVCQDCQAAGLLGPDDAESFYQFVFSLHRLGFLNLPASDDKLLYRRYRSRRAARAKSRWMSPIFLQVPLWNPDAFLARTLGAGAWLFTRWALLAWLVVVGAAGLIVQRRWSEFHEPLNGLLANDNLPLLWITLIVLKTFHELGHAYACRTFGGHVPEIGVNFILGTPVAYVDASASWGFSARWKRIVVALAGMYVEMVFAAAAVFVWAATPPGPLNSAAYNTIFLASAVTLLFNANPLMRYDGYYVLSDLLEIPNLRQRSQQLLSDLARRVVLGVRTPLSARGALLVGTLLVFGVLASAYKLALQLGIATLIAAKLPFVGVALAAAYVGWSVLSWTWRTAAYLWFDDETAPVRTRAVVVSALLLAGGPAIAAFAPVPGAVCVRAFVAAEVEADVRAAVSGVVDSESLVAGRSVRAGETLVRLANPDVDERIADAAARLASLRVRADAQRVDAPALAALDDEKAAAAAEELKRRRAERDALELLAPIDGRVVACSADRAPGVFVEAGSRVATVVAGEHRVRALLTEAEVDACMPRVGGEVAFRPSTGPQRSLRGRIVSVHPAGSRGVTLAPLMHEGGGEVVVSPLTHEAPQPYFELVAAIDAADAAALQHGATGTLRAPSRWETLARSAQRRVMRVLNTLAQN